MRTFCVALVGAAALTGCSMTVAGSIPDAKGHARPYSLHIDSRAQGRDVVAKSLGFSPIFAATANGAATKPGAPSAGELDVATVAREAMRVPAELDAVRHDLTVFVSVTAGTGALGLVLFVTGRRRRLSVGFAPVPLDPRPIVVDSVATGKAIEPPRHEPVLAQPEPTAVAAAEPEPRRCACSAPIAARSRTGRCRRCARNARGTRPRVLHVEMPPTIAAQGFADVDEDSIEPARAVLASSRIGKQRPYYIVEAPIPSVP